MSLNQYYTWTDFKGEKGNETLKRTSAEGQKAFEQARKEKLKAYLKDRMAGFEKEKESIGHSIEKLNGRLKGLKNHDLRKAVLKKISKRQQRLRDLDQSISRDQNRAL